jgi:uncharacterized protein
MAGTRVTFLSPRRAGEPAEIRLAGRLYLTEEADPEWRAGITGSQGMPGLVVGHGAGSCAARHEAFCLEACRQGFAVLALDFRGHGGSEGVADGPLELDIVAAAAFLRGYSSVDPDRICYRGSSMGGFYGLKAALPAEFAAIALLCPASEQTLLALLSGAEDTVAPGDSEAPADASEPSARWDRSAFRAYLEAQDSTELATRLTCPVLLVHARGDEQVPFAHSLMLAGRFASDTTFVALAGGSHTSAQHDPGVSAYTAEWLLRNGG